VDRLDMRISDAERQEIVERLRTALSEGRLDLDEYDERVAAAYQAKTYRDLAPLTADLPALPARVDARAGQSRRGVALLSGLLVFVGLGVLLSVAAGGVAFPLAPLVIFAFWGLLRNAGRYDGR
jgi:hypothetical protein